MTPQLHEELLAKFQEMIYNKSALRFSPSRRVHLETKIRSKLVSLGFNSLEEYLSFLQNDNKELGAFIESITTKETHFFRLPQQFMALMSMVLPQIEERLCKEAMRRIVDGGGSQNWKVPLRIWSAGCATGEEPYSIAMSVANSLKYSRSWKVEILATDLSREALSKASAGVFEECALKRVPEEYRRFFRQEPPDKVSVAESLKEKIVWRIFNLQRLIEEDRGPLVFKSVDGSEEAMETSSMFEIIFCRNVMIYFDLPAQQKLINGLFERLKPGGFLFTGDAELLHIYSHRFNTIERDGAIFYQKPEI